MIYLSKAALICLIGAVISILLFCSLGTFNIDCGFFVLIAMVFLVFAFVLGIFSLIVNFIINRKLKPIIYSVIGIILSAPAIYVLIGVEMHTKTRMIQKRELTGLYNLELLGKELTGYAEDNNGYLPVADKWCDLLMEHNPELSKENFMHPQHPNLPKDNYRFSYPDKFNYAFNFKGDCQFAFNKNLSGVKLDDISKDTVLLFEADGAWNLNGTSELLKTRYNKDGFVRMFFVDNKSRVYWFYKDSIRKFGKDGNIYYEKPCWGP